MPVLVPLSGGMWLVGPRGEGEHNQGESFLLDPADIPFSISVYLTNDVVLDGLHFQRCSAWVDCVNNAESPTVCLSNDAARLDGLYPRCSCWLGCVTLGSIAHVLVDCFFDALFGSVVSLVLCLAGLFFGAGLGWIVSAQTKESVRRGPSKEASW